MKDDKELTNYLEAIGKMMLQQLQVSTKIMELVGRRVSPTMIYHDGDIYDITGGSVHKWGDTGLRIFTSAEVEFTLPFNDEEERDAFFQHLINVCVVSYKPVKEEKVQATSGMGVEVELVKAAENNT